MQCVEFSLHNYIIIMYQNSIIAQCTMFQVPELADRMSVLLGRIQNLEPDSQCPASDEITTAKDPDDDKLKAEMSDLTWTGQLSCHECT